MTVRKAKKKLKSEMDWLHPDKPAYTWISWSHKKKVFFVETNCGARKRVMY